jgi:hypothetical protein
MAPIFRLSFRQTDLERDELQAAEARRTAGLVGIAVTLALLIVGLFLVQRLHHAAKIEDCLLSGRNNCDALVYPQH